MFTRDWQGEHTSLDFDANGYDYGALTHLRLVCLPRLPRWSARFRLMTSDKHHHHAAADCRDPGGGTDAVAAAVDMTVARSCCRLH